MFLLNFKVSKYVSFKSIITLKNIFHRYTYSFSATNYSFSRVYLISHINGVLKQIQQFSVLCSFCTILSWRTITIYFCSSCPKLLCPSLPILSSWDYYYFFLQFCLWLIWATVPPIIITIIRISSWDTPRCDKELSDGG